MHRSALRSVGLLGALFLLALTGVSGSSAGDTKLPPLTITNVQVAQLTSFGATVTWQTNRPATDQLSYGTDLPVLWTPVSAGYTTAHTVKLDGLTFSTTYTLRVLSADQNGGTAKAQLSLTTPNLEHVKASTQNGAILIDGNPVLPIAMWASCRDSYSRLLGLGINMYVANGCDENEFGSLGGRALSMGDINNRLADEPYGFIGWYYPDEWDLRLSAGTTPDQLGPRVNVPGRITFLNLSSHSWSGAAKFPDKPASWYDMLKALPDVIGLDLYPMTSFCDSSKIPLVYDAAREFAGLGKPSFQWIETRAMDCGSDSTKTVPTPDTVRAETWLALIGGAHTIGYFPPDISAGIAAQIAAQDRQITALAPALLQPEHPVSVSPSPTEVRATARVLNGALYVFLANGNPDTTAKVRVTVPGLHDRALTSYDRSRSIDPVLDTFSDTIPPLGTRIYIATPDGS